VCTDTETQTAYAKAARAELNQDFDGAFRLYLDAAKMCLHLSRSNCDAQSQAQWKADASRALDRAERIRAHKKDLTPVLRDPFSERMSCGFESM